MGAGVGVAVGVGVDRGANRALMSPFVNNKTPMQAHIINTQTVPMAPRMRALERFNRFLPFRSMRPCCGGGMYLPVFLTLSPNVINSSCPARLIMIDSTSELYIIILTFSGR
jgi:hypothetical protein